MKSHVVFVTIGTEREATRDVVAFVRAAVKRALKIEQQAGQGNDEFFLRAREVKIVDVSEHA